MAAPPITGSTRYIPEGVTHFYFVSSIANYLSPTRAGYPRVRRSANDRARRDGTSERSARSQSSPRS